MNEDEKHNRNMNMNAHFAWALVMWGSAELARERENYLCSQISYYYSTFHAGFAVINTDHTFHFEDMKRISHSKVEDWLESKLPLELIHDFKILRQVRETINYLGSDEPASKLRIVRGHPFGFHIGVKSLSFFEMVSEASYSSKRIILYLLNEIEDFCHTQSCWGPKRGSTLWQEEYLQEDLFLGVIPRGNDGVEILKRAFSLLEADGA